MIALEMLQTHISEIRSPRDWRNLANRFKTVVVACQHVET